MRNLLFLVIGTILFAGCKHKDGIFCVLKDGSEYVRKCKTYKDGNLIQVEELGPKDIYSLQRSGAFLKFSLNGDTLLNAYYCNGRLVGNYYEYYNDGHPKIYRYFDSYHEDTMFYRAFNEKGEIIDQKGELTFYTELKAFDSINADTAKFISLVQGIPRTSTDVQIYIVDSSRNLDTIRKLGGYYPPDQGRSIYMTYFLIPHAGKYVAYYRINVSDTLRGMLFYGGNQIDFHTH